MTITEDQLKAAHKHSSKNKIEITDSEICGCFCCLKIFEPKEIMLWYDQTKAEFVSNPESDDCTAICPFCGTDSVISSASDHTITSNFLKEMQTFWF